MLGPHSQGFWTQLACSGGASVRASWQTPWHQARPPEQRPQVHLTDPLAAQMCQVPSSPDQPVSLPAAFRPATSDSASGEDSRQGDSQDSNYGSFSSRKKDGPALCSPGPDASLRGTPGSSDPVSATRKGIPILFPSPSPTGRGDMTKRAL